MGNALVKANTRTQIATTAYDPFAAAGEDMGGSNAAYLRFNGTTGEYTYGSEAEEIPDGTRMAVDMNSFRRGWICWVDSKPVDEQMVRVIDGPPPAKGDLTDHGPYVSNEDRTDGWVEQSAVTLRDIETGKEFTFKIATKSGLRSLGTLLKDYSKDYKTHIGELPIVELGSQSFIPKVKKYGKKYSPILKIVAWVAEEELMAKFGENAADYEQGGDEGEGEDAPETDAQAETEALAAAAKASQTPAATPAAAPAAGPRRRNF